jgi:hypothetical protein
MGRTVGVQSKLRIAAIPATNPCALGFGDALVWLALLRRRSLRTGSPSYRGGTNLSEDRVLLRDAVDGLLRADHGLRGSWLTPLPLLAG